MIIGVDCDGVICDFNTTFIALCKRVTGRDLYPAGYEPLTWNYPESLGYTADEVSAVWDVIKADQRFWLKLPVYPETKAALDYLRERRYHRDDVYFITNRMGSWPKWQTEVWLSMMGFSSATVLLSAMKGLCARALNLDVYIDDKWENCVDVVNSSACTRTFLMDRPWNRHTYESMAFTRVSSVVGIAD
jgi:uncharacterized HAD superfamily protein